MNNNTIFASPRELPLGYIDPKDHELEYVSDDEGDFHRAKHIFVKRVATKDEYLAQYANGPLYKQAFQDCYTRAFYFYEILMD